MRIIAFFAIAIFMSGCADSTKFIRPDYVNPQELSKIKRDSLIYVSVPIDGSYGTKKYIGSGRMVAEIIRNATIKHTDPDSVVIGTTPATRADALRYARENGFDYLFYPLILHWEDRATEWSGIPDKIELRIDVIETMNDSIIDAAIVTGTSGLATLGGDHPQDLVPDPVNQFVNGLF